jgi:L-ascorbate metabolism protein UlaG (beta-lactamase superfamily)
VKILKRIAFVLLLLVFTISMATVIVLQQPVFGQEPKSARLERMKQSPNYQKGKFRNLIDTPMMSEDASYWKLIGMRLAGGKDRSPDSPIPSIKRNIKETGRSENARITWFGHSTLLVQLAGMNVLIDPIFSKRASPFQFVGPMRFDGTGVYTADDLPPIDYLLISHDHYDHLDMETIKALIPKVGAYYIPLGVGAHLEKWGVPASKIHELDWWEEVQLTPDLLLAATPSRHFSGRGLTDRDKTLWASYVLKSSSQSVYLGGDSGYGPHYQAIGEKYGPFDLTLLECGQYHEYWPNIHMMPEETAQAHLDLKGKVLMPIHWGKFELSLHSWTEPVQRLLKKAAELHIPVITPLLGAPVDSFANQADNRWWEDISSKK